MSKAIKKVGSMDFWASAPHKNGVPEYGGPRDSYTANSSLESGRLTLDPSIRNLQDQGLNKMNSIYGDVGNATDRYIGSTQSLRDSIGGESGAFIQSRVNPILQRFGRLRDTTQQNLGQRGLSGSSFADQSMRNIETDASREEGDARAQANMEIIAAQSGLDSNVLSAAMQRATLQAGLNNENYQVAAARLQEELAGLGLSQAQIQQAMGQFNQGVNQVINNSLAQDNRFNTWMNGFKTFSSIAGGSGGGGGRA